MLKYIKTSLLAIFIATTSLSAHADKNEATLDQSGTSNLAGVVQQGLQNNFEGYQYGQDNSAYLTQTGNKNIAYLEQIGSTNYHDVAVQGNANNIRTYMGSNTLYANDDVVNNNVVSANIVGNSNQVINYTLGHNDSTTSGNTNNTTLNGNSNTTHTLQLGAIGNNYSDTRIQGDSNSALVAQYGTSQSQLNIHGNSNLIVVQQAIESKTTAGQRTALVNLDNVNRSFVSLIQEGEAVTSSINIKNGNNNHVAVKDSGQNILANIAIDGSSNSVTFDRALQPAINLTGSAVIQGNNNFIYGRQHATNSDMAFDINGDSNRAEIYQNVIVDGVVTHLADGNNAYIEIDGNDNEAVIRQARTSNSEAGILQQGNANSALLTQNGNNNQGYISQFGNSNVATLTQTGNNYASITQSN